MASKPIDLAPICPQDSPSDIALDWVTNIAYITFRRRGSILAYDLKSSLHATVYEARHHKPDAIVAVPSEGYEFLPAILIE